MTENGFDTRARARHSPREVKTMKFIGSVSLATMLGLFAVAAPALHTHAPTDSAHHHHHDADDHYHDDADTPSDSAEHCAACDWQNTAADRSVPAPALAPLFNAIAVFAISDFIAPLNDAMGFSLERAPPVCA